MGRKLFYRVEDLPTNRISDEEWDSALRLQKWYNSEFVWTCGRLAFKMYAVFPNWEFLSIDSNSYWSAVRKRSRELRQSLKSENEVVRTLERERLVVIKKGGYHDGSLASGFTKVAGNEFNAYLVCEFILKLSTIARNCEFLVRDEGGFIKCRKVRMKAGKVKLRAKDPSRYERLLELAENHHVFSIVDPSKYDQHPIFKTTVADFNEMNEGERRAVLQDWNWLGFTSAYDVDGDDLQGYDLNKKVLEFEIERP